MDVKFFKEYPREVSVTRKVASCDKKWQIKGIV